MPSFIRPASLIMFWFHGIPNELDIRFIHAVDAENFTPCIERDRWGPLLVEAPLA